MICKLRGQNDFNIWIDANETIQKDTIKGICLYTNNKIVKIKDSYYFQNLEQFNKDFL